VTTCTNLFSMLVHLGHTWEKKPRKMEWLEFEQTLVDIINLPDASEHTKLECIKECIDAYTRRGHFRQTT
jgi:hypothetical protein